jgi:glycine oxidase
MRVVIVGAGVIGCATALELAKRNVDVTLLERGVPGSEASSAAAGILGAQLESEDDATLSAFARAYAAYTPWVDELCRETGQDVGYRVSGLLALAHDEAEHARLTSLVAAHVRHGLRAEMLSGDQARGVEPGLAPAVASAAYFPDDAQVDPPLLVRALVTVLSRHPAVTLRTPAAVERMLMDDERCIGVQLTDEERILADAVILAAGSWSSLVGVIAAPPVRPARGQMVLLEERPPKLRTMVCAAHAYAVPRGDGRVLCGSTIEFVGFRREVTAGGVHDILRGTLGAVPSLAEAELVKTWAGFRPHAEHPLVGKTKVPGLYFATGHYRNGILLAKTTAEDVTAAVLGT